MATSVRFLTGHAREGGEPGLDAVVTHAADPATTLVVYMGLATLPKLAAQLVTDGLPGDTPAAAIERGTTPQQRVVCAQLAGLVEAVREAQLCSPTLIIIGHVVALSPHWQAHEAAAVGHIAAAKSA